MPFKRLWSVATHHPWCTDHNGHEWAVWKRQGVWTLGHGEYERVTLQCRKCGKRRTHYIPDHMNHNDEIGKLLSLRY